MGFSLPSSYTAQASLSSRAKPIVSGSEGRLKSFLHHLPPSESGRRQPLSLVTERREEEKRDGETKCETQTRGVGLFLGGGRGAFCREQTENMLGVQLTYISICSTILFCSSISDDDVAQCLMSPLLK